MMKKKYVMLPLLLMTLSAIASERLKNLVVWTKDGTKVMYALKERPRINFTNTDMIITTNSVEINYSIENMERFTYEDSETTFITNPKTGKMPFIYDGESILFSCLPPNSTISIYTLNGLVIESRKHLEGKYVYYLSNLENGIYLIVVNNVTYKIIKK